MSRSVFALVAGFVLGVPCAQSDEFRPPDGVKATATLTVDASDPTAVVAKVHVEFQGYYRVSEPLPVQRDAAGRFLLQAKAEPLAVIQIFPPPPFPVADLTYKLGAVGPGSHVAVFKMNGQAFAEKAFTVGADTLPKVEARVTAKVESSAIGTAAHVRIELPDPYFEMIDPGHPVREGQAVRINATLVRINTLVAIPAPKIIERDYLLGPLARGDYKLIYKINGETKLEMPFSVGARPEYELRVVHLEVGASPSGRHVTVTVPAPPAGKAIDWGQVERSADGNQFGVHLKVVDVPPVDPATGAAGDAGGESLLHHRYDLGPLAEGTYKFVVFDAGTRVLGAIEFRVGAPPPPGDVRLAFIEIRPGPVSTVASVGLVLPAGQAVTDWGEVKTEGTIFRASITVGDAPTPPPTDPATGAADAAGVAGADVPILPVPIVKHHYSLGLVGPGEYAFELLEGSRLLGSKPFRVEPKPPPPPPPRPVVAFIQPGHDGADWFVDVGLAFSRPALEVKDWGTPARNGNEFKVNILIGEATPPADPTVPPAGGIPVFLGPPIAANDPAIPAAEADRFHVIGDWPAQLVRHRYPLGPLDPGEYIFVVLLGGGEVAHKGFAVGEAPTPGSSMTVRADAITKKTDAAQVFTVVYESASGFKSDPGAGSVVVRGPHDFSGKAVLTGCVQSLDPIGRLVMCTYEVEGPGGGWDAADNGEYSVCVDPSFVVDGNGKELARPCAFGWRVRIEPEPPPHLEAGVAVSMKDGEWQADVSFENTGGWVTAVWGDPHIQGTVFSARAELRAPPVGALPPIPIGFEHTYPLGELKPGRYGFVFKSSAGHFGSATFEVPGVEPPTPLAQWKLNVLGENAGSDTSDDDHDGLPLFAEFYLGCRPDRADPPALAPALVAGAEGDPHLVFEFRRVSAGDGSVRCIVQVSKDMIEWQDAGDDIDLLPQPPDVDGTQRLRAAQKLPIGRSPWPFMRLKLEQTRAP